MPLLHNENQFRRIAVLFCLTVTTVRYRAPHNKTFQWKLISILYFVFHMNFYKRALNHILQKDITYHLTSILVRVTNLSWRYYCTATKYRYAASAKYYVDKTTQCWQQTNRRIKLYRIYCGYLNVCERNENCFRVQTALAFFNNVLRFSHAINETV